MIVTLYGLCVAAAAIAVGWGARGAWEDRRRRRARGGFLP